MSTAAATPGTLPAVQETEAQLPTPATVGEASGGGALVPAAGGGDGGGAGGSGGLVQVLPLQQIFAQPAVRRAVPAIAAVFVVLAFAIIYFWMEEPVYRALYPGMAEGDRQGAYEALMGAGYEARIDGSTGQLQVPEGRYHEARLFLAGQGLPLGSVEGGFDALAEQSSMTQSQFMEQVRYNAAIERELGRTIAEISSIANARVHIAMAKQSPFVRERTPPKASVTVTPYGGRVVTERQVEAIVHLVSASVPYLPAENVAVVDHLGTLLTGTADRAAMGMNGTQLDYKRNVEDELRGRVLKILAPIVGAENVRAEIDVAMDFTQTESTIERYDEAGQGPKTRSETLASERGSELAAIGVPGAVSNEPPEDPAFTEDGTATEGEGQAGGAGTFSSRSTRNYELDRRIEHTKRASGTIERLSVAVVVNALPLLPPAPAGEEDEGGEAAASVVTEVDPARLERLTNLVRGAVGAVEDRGDLVTLEAVPFEPLVEPQGLPWYESPSVASMARAGMAAALFLVILLTVIRPVLKTFLYPTVEGDDLSDPARLLAEGGELTEEELASIEIGEGESLEDIRAKLKPKKSSISADMLDTANTYDDKVALIRMIVNEDAGRVANVLKNMVRVD